jgi:hypothetical protein
MILSILTGPRSKNTILDAVQRGILRVNGKMRRLPLLIPNKISAQIKVSPDTKEDRDFLESQDYLIMLEVTLYTSRRDI